MAALDELCELRARYKDSVDFMFVYIEEIHAADAWNFESNK